MEQTGKAMTDHEQRATIELKLTQLQAMTAHDALVSPEHQQRAERARIVQEILDDYAQAHAGPTPLCDPIPRPAD